MLVRMIRVFLLVALLFNAGCSRESEPVQSIPARAADPVPAQPAAQQAAKKPTPLTTPPAERGTIILRRLGYSDAWPFEADEATLRCRSYHNVIITTDDVTYAVNGTAMGHAESNGWENLDSLYLKSEFGLDLTPEDIKFRQELIDRGLKLCDE